MGIGKSMKGGKHEYEFKKIRLATIERFGDLSRHRNHV